MISAFVTPMPCCLALGFLAKSSGMLSFMMVTCASSCSMTCFCATFTTVSNRRHNRRHDSTGLRSEIGMTCTSVSCTGFFLVPSISFFAASRKIFMARRRAKGYHLGSGESLGLSLIYVIRPPSIQGIL